LECQVVEFFAAHVRERGPPTRNLEAGGTQQELVKVRHGLVALGSR
jgi:hypothetical protein